MSDEPSDKELEEMANEAHTKKLIEALVGFCMNAMTTATLEDKKKLQEWELSRVANIELERVLKLMQSPRMMDHVVREALKYYRVYGINP